MPENNLTSNFKDIAKKYGPYALLASLAAGAGNTYLAYKAKPANETAKQRRNRLLKAFLLPTLTTALGSAALGLSAATFKSDLTPESAKKLNEVEKKLNPASNKVTEGLLTQAGSIATPALATAAGAGAGYKMVGKPVAHTIKEFGPIARSITRGAVGNTAKALLKVKNKKIRSIGHLLRLLTPKAKATNPEAFDIYVAPIIGAGTGVAGGAMGLGAERAAENYLKDFAFGEERPVITQSDLDKF